MNAEAQEVLEREVTGPTPMDQAVVSAISKAELAEHVATAHANPRSVTKFKKEAWQLATLDEETADDCIYALPRREQGQQKMIEGPSARLAEIIAYSWGNCSAAARVVAEDREFITAQGVFQDLERNVRITYEVRRRITNRNNQRFSADMIAVTGNAACSIALRNAVFKGVPKAFWNPIYEAARKVCAGDAMTLVNRRSEVLAVLQKVGATQDMVLAKLGRQGIDEITVDDIVVLKGIRNAIRDGEMTLEAAFAPEKDEAGANAGPAGTADRAKEILRGGAAGTQPEPQTGTQTPSSDTPGTQPPEPQKLDSQAEAWANTLRVAKSSKELDKLWKDCVADYGKAGARPPLPVEAARNEHRDQLEL